MGFVENVNIVASGNYEDIVNNIDEIKSVGANIDSVVITATDIVDIKINAADIDNINTNAFYIEDIKLAKPSADAAKVSENASAASAIVATEKANSILDLTTSSQTLVAGSPSSAEYNPATGNITFGIPIGNTGPQGLKGDSFNVDATGVIANRYLYDSQPKGYSFFATDESLIYFKNSVTSADWGIGSPFGKGDTGNGVLSNELLSGTHAPGTLDTYRITYTDTTTFDYYVYNGADGAVMSVNGATGNVTLADLNLENVDNTTDLNKPISTATQLELNKKPQLNVLATKTANYLAVNWDYIPVNTSLSIITILAPLTPNAGDKFIIDNESEVNTLSIDGNGTQMMFKGNLADGWDTNIVATYEVVFDGTQWRIN